VTTRAEPTEASTNGQTTILLVDDHGDTSKVFQMLLERRGYAVSVASSVAQALELAKGQVFDLLISDIGLPDGTGLDIMRKLREVRDIPGIALSGFGMEEDRQRSHEAGFSEHLTKPVNFQKLYDAVQRLIQRDWVN
jgi:CheY-like chemotaxis protein